ncbi:phage holin family protein [Kingella oralis]|jgi:hypothetical protein|uniref:Uncharacterized protein n=1 Tax=Kingella oralis ATCC 51147 TaxID=629741 RepID=C4GGI1_9NEIS|nr:phage holin family protein [Kingella oralis]EEP69336.1 hypothetical protein GCWU000324_01249 [Kingella oralis ATCC 51147]QMT43844.1 phage holin family protein [Kingella oralis]DAM84786.1 MAG TPA: hypothetical protein [Caudoviricetes sp.]
MTNLQNNAIIALSLAAAISLLLFDSRHKTHKPISALIAWLLFIQMSAIFLAVLAKSQALLNWLLIANLALQTGSILYARGNVSRIYHPKKATHEQQQL